MENQNDLTSCRLSEDEKNKQEQREAKLYFAALAVIFPLVMIFLGWLKS